MYMGKIIYGVLLLLVVGAGRLCAGQNEWENPERYEWNKESPHTVFMWYDDEPGALAGDFSKSPWHESLNGRWKFSYRAGRLGRPRSPVAFRVHIRLCTGFPEREKDRDDQGGQDTG